jgi:hypothetical protein
MNESGGNDPTRPMPLHELAQWRPSDSRLPAKKTDHEPWRNTNIPTDDEDTRPMALSEMPRAFRIDHEMAIIRKHNERVAKAIETFWGHRDCVEYLEQLLLNGGDGVGKARIGFKHEVMAALITLTSLHEVKQR